MLLSSIFVFMVRSVPIKSKQLILLWGLLLSMAVSSCPIKQWLRVSLHQAIPNHYQEKQVPHQGNHLTAFNKTPCSQMVSHTIHTIKNHLPNPIVCFFLLVFIAITAVLLWKLKGIPIVIHQQNSFTPPSRYIRYCQLRI